MLTKKQMETLAQARYELLRPIDLISLDNAIVLEQITNELKELETLSTDDVCQKRYARFEIPGSVPKDFQERIISLENGDFILAGIRFRNLELDRPFVSAWSSSSKTSTDIITDCIKKEFSIFKPKFLEMRLPHSNFYDANIDRLVVAGLIKEMPNLHSEKVQLRAALSIDFYDRYLEEYEAFYKKDPELRHEVRTESPDGFDEPLKEGLLFKVFINEKFAGIMAGQKSDLYGRKGLCVYEELLFQKFKGQGYGPLVQNAFAKKFENEFELLWGTISPLNYRSLKTAFRNGRKITEADYFFRLT